MTWVFIGLLVAVGVCITIWKCFQHTQSEERFRIVDETKPEVHIYIPRNKQENNTQQVQKRLTLADQPYKYRQMVRERSILAKRRHTELYRLLRDSESIERGLRAKSAWDDTAKTDVVTHVAYGSSWAQSRYISTCASLRAVKELYLLKNRSSYANGKSGIVKINVSKLPSNVILIDLTSEEYQEPHIKSSHDSGDICRFRRFANNFEEVLIEDFIPPECLSYVPGYMYMF